MLPLLPTVGRPGPSIASRRCTVTAGAFKRLHGCEASRGPAAGAWGRATGLPFPQKGSTRVGRSPLCPASPGRARSVRRPSPSPVRPVSATEPSPLLSGLPLPPAVQSALQPLLAPAARAAPPRLREPQRPAPGWALAPDAGGGWLLLQEPTAGASPLPWVAGDRFGAVHLRAEWRGGDTEVPVLRGAWLRLPGAGWLAVQPDAANFALWGRSDALQVHPGLPRPGGGARAGLLPCQPYGRLERLPPFDAPGRLPPGAGAVMLNFLALLRALQGGAPITYRGPYPTQALFQALRHSFVPAGDPAAARTAFTAREGEAAFSAVMEENAVPWRPAPFAMSRPLPAVAVAYRDGVERAWVHGVPFTRVAAGGGALPGGQRLWSAGADGAGWAVGLVLLGRPEVPLLQLDPLGNVLQTAPPADDVPAGSGPALAEPWPAVVLAWCALRAPAPLAPSVLALAGTLPLRWAPLPREMARAAGGAVQVQAALALAYRRRRVAEDPAALAMMLISDVLEAVTPHLLRAAQEALADDAAAVAPDALHAAGQQAQAEARRRLEDALPRLVAALAAGAALPPDDG